MILNANPKLENKFFFSNIIKKLQSVINSGKYILGQEVENFEKNFSKFIGSKYCVGVNSGTDALIIALRALKVGKNDEVIVPALSASATAIAVKNVGAKIVYADLDINTYNITAKTIKSKISKKTKAIIVVHLHGLSAEVLSIKKIIKNTKIKIIEDCAQSHGSKLNNKYTGNLGDIGCFSFYPTKNLNCIGDGGAITTNNKGVFNLAKKIRQYGWTSRDNSKIFGMNSRLDEIQAAILLIKLKKISYLNNQRRKIAKKYFQNIKKSKKIILPKFIKIDNHVFHHFVIRLNKIDRSKLIKSFLKKGIQILVHYERPLFKQKALSAKPVELFNTLKIANNTISLPIYPNIKNEYIKKICSEINKYA
jgi:dTDP-4-amino-4,6-dideoxygalactose transaminase